MSEFCLAKKVRVQWLILLSLLGSAAISFAQGTITFNFEGPPTISPGTGTLVTSYTESGMQFLPLAPATQFARYGPGIATSPQNGTAYLKALEDNSLKFFF